jgi:predicted transcriptional regulator
MKKLTRRIQLLLTPSDFLILEELAKKLNITKSDVFRMALKQLNKNLEGKNESL